MANPPKQKGTKLETAKLEQWKPVFPQLRRNTANAASYDLIGAGFPIEVKHRRKWEIPLWTRRLHSMNPRGWMLFVKYGDSRLRDAPPEICVLPMDMAWLLFKVAYEHEPDLLADAFGEDGAR